MIDFSKAHPEVQAVRLLSNTDDISNELRFLDIPPEAYSRLVELLAEQRTLLRNIRTHLKHV